MAVSEPESPTEPVAARGTRFGCEIHRVVFFATCHDEVLGLEPKKGALGFNLKVRRQNINAATDESPLHDEAAHSEKKEEEKRKARKKRSELVLLSLTQPCIEWGALSVDSIRRRCRPMQAPLWSECEQQKKLPRQKVPLKV